MNIDELLSNKSLYSEDPETGSIYPKEGYLFQLNGYSNEYFEFFWTETCYYVYDKGGYKHRVTKDDIEVNPDRAIINCDCYLKTNHSERYFITNAGNEPREYLPETNDLENEVVSLLIDKFTAYDIEYSYAVSKITFKVNLRCLFEDSIFNLLLFRMISIESFNLWLELMYK